MDIKLRSLVAADLPEIVLVEQASHPFPWTIGILNDCLKVGYPGWVLAENNVIVGYAMMSLAAEECHILNLCVIPAARRRGYARKLMEMLLAYGKQKGAEVAFLEVRTSNKAARNLYSQLGFNEIGVRKGYYPAANDKREDAIMLGYQFSQAEPD